LNHSIFYESWCRDNHVTWRLPCYNWRDVQLNNILISFVGSKATVEENNSIWVVKYWFCMSSWGNFISQYYLSSNDWLNTLFDKFPSYFKGFFFGRYVHNTEEWAWMHFLIGILIWWHVSNSLWTNMILQHKEECNAKRTLFL